MASSTQRASRSQPRRSRRRPRLPPFRRQGAAAGGGRKPLGEPDRPALRVAFSCRPGVFLLSGQRPEKGYGVDDLEMGESRAELLALRTLFAHQIQEVSVPGDQVVHLGLDRQIEDRFVVRIAWVLDPSPIL